MALVAVGQQLGSYRLVQQLGAGAMGVVFLAEHVVLKRRAAIKVLQPQLAQRRDLFDRFYREARATAAIHHPGIVDIYDYGHADNGAPYIVMEHLSGESLASRLERERLPLQLALAFMRQVCNAVAAVHALGILHRDLKPDNLFLIPDADLPGGHRVKVLDFGIAKLQDALFVTGEALTQAGATMGTSLYMAPEQCRGLPDIDHRCDIYSVGCILYELVAGQPPFVFDNAMEVIAAHLSDAPQPPHELAPGLPEALDMLILRALSKQREDRPASMVELAAALDAIRVDSMPRIEVVAIAVTAPETPTPTASVKAPTRHVATTMGSAASQQMTVPAAPRETRSPLRGIALGIGAAGALAAGGIAIVLAMRDRPSNEPPHDAAAITALAADASSDAETDAAIDAAIDAAVDAAIDATTDATTDATIDAGVAPQAEHVVLQIKSTPSGATVEEQGQLLGHTPLTLSRPQGDGIARFVLRRRGYREMLVEMSLGKNAVARTVLVASPRPPRGSAEPIQLDDEPIRPPRRTP